ncbi:MAG: AmmeMemoRadiSam system protein A [Chloroflexota bacterium]
MSGIIFGCIAPHPPILLPEIAGGRQREIDATTKAMNRLTKEVGKQRPETLLVISPHGVSHYDAMGIVTGKATAGSFASWGVSGLDFHFANDLQMVKAIREEAKKLKVPLVTMGDRGYELDHGVLVPMYFLHNGIEGVPLVPLTFSWLPLSTHFTFGQAIRKAAEKTGKRVAILASGDLSHRLIPSAPAGFDPMGNTFDKQLVDAVAAMDTQAILNMDANLVERAGECGLRSIVILLGALDGLPLRQEVLSYEGPFGVGYMVASFHIKGAQEDPLVALARRTVEGYVKDRTVPDKPTVASPEMKEKAGVFVCLKKHGELRGCIGTFEPTRPNVAEEIVVNAISSATRDPRFTPVTPTELGDLSYSVDILTKPEPVDSVDKLHPKRYGVIVEAGGRRGLLLPDLEGVDTVEQQIDICRRKGGIYPDDPVKLYRFKVRRHE